MTMQVLFVGGPRDGHRVELSQCPDLYPLQWSDGTAAVYVLRRETTETVAGDTYPIHVTYALQGMSEEEFHTRLKELGPP